MKRIKSFLLLTIALFIGISFQSAAEKPANKNKSNGWENLLDKDLSKWDVWLGIPHKSTGIPGYETVENVKTDTYPALGLGNKRNVFSVIQENGEDVLKVTGEIFGSLMSKNEYQNYHLKFQVKWGEKLWEPMLKAKRNNGLLYHSIGEPGKGLWNTWMTCLEFEVENTNFGDFITINNDGNIHAKCPAEKTGNKFYYNPDAPLVDFGWSRFPDGRCYKTKDLEKPLGEWTTVELISFNGMNLHIIEGEVVMAVYEAKFFDGKKWIPMNKGKLQLQSEGAETYFKDIRIKPIKKLEERFQKYVK